MRKNFAIWAVAGSMLLAWAGEASAQRGGGRSYGGGGRGYGGGNTIRGNSGYNGNRGYQGGYYGNRGYGRGFSSFGIGLGLGYAGATYYGNGYGNSYYSPSIYAYSPPAYSYGTTYYAATPTYAVGPTTYFYPQQAATSVPAETIRTSLYSPMAVTSQAASITVMLPTSDNSIWFDTTPMASQGTQSTFQSPSLEVGSTYVYTIKARWKAGDGNFVEQSRRVEVRAGQSSTADFR